MAIAIVTHITTSLTPASVLLVHLIAPLALLIVLAALVNQLSHFISLQHTSALA